MPTMPMSATCWPTRRTHGRAASSCAATSQPRPIGPPGAKFQYSDTGYVLLGEIIERTAGDSLAAVARRELGFDRLGLATTWWEIAEPAPAGAPRARQFLGKRDVTDVSATMDLYGGGGLVMSARDLARWTADLFEGRVYERPATLAEMLAPGAHEGADGYRLGLFAKRIGGAEVYFHLGWARRPTTARRCGWRWRASPRDARRGQECWP